MTTPSATGDRESVMTWAAWAAQFEVDGVSPGAFAKLLPEDLAAKRWLPDEPVREAAFLLHTEMVSRIATQDLHFRTGDEVTALDSVYRLFPETRRIVTEGGPATADFAVFAIGVLNRRVRWFTAKWHGKKERGAFRIEDERHAFRADLLELQPLLRGFEKALWSLARGQKRNVAGADPGGGKGARARGLGSWKGAPEGLLGMRGLEAQGKQVLADEHAHLRAAEGRPEQAFGVALSGGGIRSATVCLGVLQVLARRGVLEKADYVSCVSGGAYTGGLWAMLAAQHSSKGANDTRGRLLDDEVDRLRKRAFHHLLGGRPMDGWLKALFVLVRGWTVHALLAIALLCALAAIAGVFRGPLVDTGIVGSRMGTAGSPLVAVVLLALALVVTGAVVSTIPKLGAFRWAVILGVVLLVGSVAVDLVGRLYLLPGDLVARFGWGITVAAVLAGAWFAAVAWRRFGWARAVARLLLGGVVPVGLLLATFAFLEILAEAERAGVYWWVVGGISGSGLLVALLMDVNATSLHPLYRERLRETYLPGTGPDGLTFHSLRERPVRPYPLVNCTVNLQGSSEQELRGRGSGVFVFAPQHSGGAATGMPLTHSLEACNPGLDLARAVAISGAAASPLMGTYRRAGLQPLMTLFNVRLGQWIHRSAAAKRWFRAMGVWRLLQEATGQVDERAASWHLSDGGHIENLGILELMRRKCRFILAVDAECDERFALSGLVQALRQAEVDLGVKVEIDLSELQPDEDGLVRAHFQMGTVTYPDDSEGYLLYLKSSLTGDETRAIREYRKRCPSFPHQSTGDQFFDEEQFEMYRQLGEHMAGGLFRRGLVEADIAKEPKKHVVFDTWWRSLVGNLLLPEAPALSGTDPHPDRVAQCQ